MAPAAYPSGQSTRTAPQVFLDCDGVLADFDVRAEEVFGMKPSQAEDSLGSEQFWATLRAHPDFYRNLPQMPDAGELVHAVADLQPIILTGCPRGGWAEQQKLDWAADHFPTLKMITCRAVEKRLHMQAGDILIDDRPQHKHLWEEAGGIFIVHTSARQSIAQLRQLGVLSDNDSPNPKRELHVR